MTQEDIALFGGALLSLAFSYIPGLKQKFDDCTSEHKQLFMLLSMFVVAVLAFALSCGGFIDVGIVCDAQGAFDLLSLFVLAVMANQGMYKATNYIVKHGK